MRKRRPAKARARSVREDPPEYGSGATGAGRSFRFIDLFCGIGGFRLAFERAGCKCVFSSDWDKYAQLTYEANFGEKPHGVFMKTAGCAAELFYR